MIDTKILFKRNIQQYFQSNVLKNVPSDKFQRQENELVLAFLD